MSEGELSKTLIVNTASLVIDKLKSLDEEKQKFVVRYVYSLALASFKKLSPEELGSFQNDCIALLTEYIK